MNTAKQHAPLQLEHYWSNRVCTVARNESPALCTCSTAMNVQLPNISRGPASTTSKSDPDQQILRTPLFVLFKTHPGSSRIRFHFRPKSFREAGPRDPVRRTTRGQLQAPLHLSLLVLDRIDRKYAVSLLDLCHNHCPLYRCNLLLPRF
jgi:hypothetical protein